MRRELCHLGICKLCLVLVLFRSCPFSVKSDGACKALLTASTQLEDFDSTVPLYPTVPKLKANCRLWIDFVRPVLGPFGRSKTLTYLVDQH
jgi:hypothetical protein